MDFRQLPYFLGVYEAKSITKASERLNVAQPALGLQVRKLEDELGVDLFFRHSRGVTPTEAGQLLAEHARVLLRQFERVRQDLIDFGGQPHGRVAVGMTASSCLVVAEHAGRLGMEDAVVKACRVKPMVWEHYLNGIGDGADALDRGETLAAA